METSAVADDALFRTLFLTSPDAILVADATGRIVLANPRAAELFGYAADELRGLAVERLIPERLRARHGAHFAAYAAQPGTRPMGAERALHGLRRDGSEFAVEIALSPALSGGQPLFIAAVRDITDLVRTKRAARQGRYSAYVARVGMEALAHADFESLVAALPSLVREAMEADAVAILRVSPDRRVASIAAASGVPPDIARDIEIPTDERMLAGYVAAHRTAVASRDFRTEARFDVPAAFKALGLHAVAAVPLFDRDQVIGLITARSREPRDFDDDDINFLQSIANVVSAVLQRSKIEEHLLHVQRLDSMGQLTGGVAHDFNNLLMVISGNLQVLEEALPGGAALELCRAASAAVDRGAMLTRKLLAFARKQPLQPRPVELAHLLRDFRDLVQRTLGETVAVELSHDPTIPVLVVDHAQLETALLNLAINARDAMPTGGTLSIAVERCRPDAAAQRDGPDLAPGEYARIAVRDTGAGMPAEVAARAFEPFFTTKDAGKGSGLGLSMVYGFAQQSGGTARIDSAPGAGTCVSLYLPLGADAAGLAPGRPDAAPGGKETILVVEDEPAVRGIAVRFLARLGYQVLQAADAVAAQRILEGQRVDLLFTDIVLPGSTGVELARRARALQPELGVLYTSGYASGGVLRQIPEEEVRNLLAKPYRHENLASAVREALDGRRGR